MPHPTVRLELALERLTCLSLPSDRKRDPYLWVIFFKADGSTMRVAKDLTLKGEPVLHFSEGSHGNLGKKDVGVGEELTIPPSVGTWCTELKPAYAEPFEQNVTGAIGMVCALMEENNITDKGAEAGHQRLNIELANALREVLSEFHPRHVDLDDPMASLQEFFKVRFEARAKALPMTIAKAIMGKQNIFENVWSLVKRDDLIGFHFALFTHYDLAKMKNRALAIDHTIKHEKYGEWQLEGALRLV